MVSHACFILCLLRKFALLFGVVFSLRLSLKFLLSALLLLLIKLFLVTNLGLFEVDIFRCTATTSDCVNLMDKKRFRGNIVMKFDIRNVFDTMRWDFIALVFAAMAFLHCSSFRCNLFFIRLIFPSFLVVI